MFLWNGNKLSQTFFTFILFLLSSCQMFNGDSDEDNDNNNNTELAKQSFLPSPGIKQTGSVQFQGKLISSLDGKPLQNASVYQLGYPDRTVKSNEEGQFKIGVLASPKISPKASPKASPKLVEKILAKNKKDISLVIFHETESANLGMKVDEEMPTTSKDLGTLNVPQVGTLKGKVQRSSSDSTGIDVFIPGTTFIAKTDKEGRFTIEHLPVGNWQLEAHYQAFEPYIWNDVRIESQKVNELAPVWILPSTGAHGALVLNNGNLETETSEIEVAIYFSKDATLYKLSEDPLFINESWKVLKGESPFITSISLKKKGENTIYLSLTDANGIESSPLSATIMYKETIKPSVSQVKIIKETDSNASYSHYFLIKGNHLDHIKELLIKEKDVALNIIKQTTSEISAIAKKSLSFVQNNSFTLGFNTLHAEGTVTVTLTANSLEDGIVSNSKIVDGAVTSAKISDGSVTTAKLSNGAVTANILADSVVTSAKLSLGNPKVGEKLTWNGSNWVPEGNNLVVNQTSNFTVGESDNKKVYLLTTAVTVTLPAANSVATGFEITVKRGANNKVLIDRTGSDTIDGLTSLTLQSAYGFVRLMSDGSNWYVIDKKGTIVTCPEGYIHVPANPAVGTHVDFCVMKYEAKNDGGDNAVSKADGNPWVSIGQTRISPMGSAERCAAIGKGYHLITNPEWMTLARNIESLGVNWSSGTVGSGTINRGWSANTTPDTFQNTGVASSTGDNCVYNTDADTCGATGDFKLKRTHTLSNGEEIWDLSGNVWEYIDWTVKTNKAGAQQNWIELNEQDSTDTMPSYTYRSFDRSLTGPTNGIGRYYPFDNDSGGAALRGGSWNLGTSVGIYSLYLKNNPTDGGGSIGFRCAISTKALLTP